MYSITKVGDRTNSTGIREFVVDTLDGINELPHIGHEGVQQGMDTTSNDRVRAGSTCIVLEDSSVWMLGNDDIWHEL